MYNIIEFFADTRRPRFVRLLINCSFRRVIGTTTPRRALFGTDPTVGLTTSKRSIEMVLEFTSDADLRTGSREKTHVVTT